MKAKKMKSTNNKVKSVNKHTSDTECNRTIRGIIIKIMNKQAQAQVDGDRIMCLVPGVLTAGRNLLAAGDKAEIEDLAAASSSWSIYFPEIRLFTEGTGERREKKY
ncbi:hypothetical protein [Clostridium sp. AM58-1XD]|uniref:hypothetical protein n=1 Tax=Clostridium sp. AM58-1XD TaxID=2292307 RepID=UPI001FA8B567|nr:hypothetical protein [Clostridium sp. AM58-1XD]